MLPASKFWLFLSMFMHSVTICWQQVMYVFNIRNQKVNNNGHTVEPVSHI